MYYIKLDWCGDIKDQVWEGKTAHEQFSAAVNQSGTANETLAMHVNEHKSCGESAMTCMPPPFLSSSLLFPLIVMPAQHRTSNVS